MIILDNIIFSLQKAGGISIYWANLIKRIISNKMTLDVKLIEFKSSNLNIFRSEIPINPILIYFVSDKFLKIKRFLNIKKNFILNPDKWFIFHSSYYRINLSRYAINITTVHDFIYEKKVKGLFKYLHVLQKYFSLKNSDGIICISESTKRDLLELYPSMVKKPIKVIYNGYDSKSFFPLQNRTLSNSVLFVGGRNGYKNFTKVVTMLSLVNDINLTIVGSKLSKQEISFLDKKIFNRYKMFESASVEKLNALYNESICLIYPSEYEGFGIPIIEAMAAGCPTISLNISSIPEVVNNSGLLYDNFNPSLIMNDIYKLKFDLKFRSEIIEKGFRNSSRFSWEKNFIETFKFYDSFLSNFNLNIKDFNNQKNDSIK